METAISQQALTQYCWKVFHNVPRPYIALVRVLLWARPQNYFKSSQLVGAPKVHTQVSILLNAQSKTHDQLAMK